MVKRRSMTNGTILMLVTEQRPKGGTSCLTDAKCTMTLTTMAMVKVCCMECKRLAMSTTTSMLVMERKKAA